MISAVDWALKANYLSIYLPLWPSNEMLTRCTTTMVDITNHVTRSHEGGLAFKKKFSLFEIMVTVTVTGPVTRQGRRGAAETNAAPTVSTSDGRGQ